MTHLRIGNGYDVHRLEKGRKLILGGVEIPFEKGLLGHSDADVLTHAVIDAILGAAALGNIGAFFPDTDMQYKDADSLELLRQCVKAVREKGWRIVNVDTVLVAQAPRLSPHLPAMQQRLAEAMAVAPDQVSVKPKTEEKLGFTGSGEGMSAYAVCLLEKE